MASSRSGSIMWRAPRSCTQTSASGKRWASVPVAPAWSRWMWVRAMTRGEGDDAVRVLFEHRQQLLQAGGGARVDDDVADAPCADGGGPAHVQEIDELVPGLALVASEAHRPLPPFGRSMGRGPAALSRRSSA